jgi:DNA adenine methylase
VNSSIRPPMPYYGSKMSIAEQIVAFFPDHLHYVEPFAGSLSVLLAKRPSRMETVNDLDGDLQTFWRVLRDQTAELERACALTPHSRQEYMACRDAEPVADEVETARRVWLLLTQGRGGTLRDSKTGWRHFVKPRGSSIGMPGYLDGYLSRIAPAAERLRQVSLESMPALDVIAKYGVEDEVLLYVDPPYLGTTRGWGDNYKHELKSADEHRMLADALHKCAAAVVLSGYPSELYDMELFPSWSRVEIASMTGNGVDRARTEVLWSNRPIGLQPTLFDFEVAS